MIEGRRVLVGEATLSGATTADSGSRAESRDEAVEALVREHSKLVYRIAYAVLRRHQDAEDATQETFLRVLRYSSKLATVEDPKTWLARIAWRVAVDRTRHLKSKAEMTIDDPLQPMEFADSRTSADESVQSTQLKAAVDKFIEALPNKLREPLVLSALQEMTPAQVAATLGITEAAARSRVFRARQILKEKLSKTINNLREQR